MKPKEKQIWSFDHFAKVENVRSLCSHVCANVKLGSNFSHMFVSNFRNCKSGLPSLPPAECVVAVDIVPVSVVLIAPAPLVLADAFVIASFILLLVTRVSVSSVSGL